MDRQCLVTRLLICTDKDELYNQVCHPLVREDHPMKPIKPENFYLRLLDINPSIVAASIAKLKDIDPVPRILADSLSRDSGRFLETDLLELAACAEGLDRRMHKDEGQIFEPDTVAKIQRVAADAVRCELRGPLGDHAAKQVRNKLQYFEPTYKERLARLVGYTQDCVPEAAGVATTWIRSLAGARNEYAHMLPEYRNSWETNIVLRESLKWILGAAVLLHAGVGAEVIKQALGRYERYRFFTRKSKHFAPDIYANRDEG